MDKIIFEIERQIQRLQAAKQFLIDTQASTDSLDAISAQSSSVPSPAVKRGRGRPRKNPVAPKSEPIAA